MQIRYTIEEVHKVFPTHGSSPLLVTCDDFRYWVCKYDRSSMSLFKELVAARFAEIWGILTPEIALIRVKKEHVPTEKYPNISYLLDKECFGSLYLENSQEVNLSSIPLFQDAGFRNKLTNKEDFLKIALFDIWLANEDRNRNNFNLLLYAASGKMNFFYAIDHVCIFNSASLRYGITDITEEDSIIKTELAKILFGNSRNLSETIDGLLGSFYLCVEECKNKLVEIIDLVPDSWEIHKNEMRQRIDESLFIENWTARCAINFREFTQSFIMN